MSKEAKLTPQELSDRVKEAVQLVTTEGGQIELLNVGMSALNRLLVSKGIITAEELQEAFLKEFVETDLTD